MTIQIDTGSSVTYVAGKSDYIPPTNPPPYETYDSVRQTSGMPPPTAIIVQPGAGQTIIYAPPVGPNPTAITCRSCNLQTTSKISYKPTARTHILALTLCLFGCWPCVCIPYCLDSCNNVDHYCSNCNAYIGTYSQ